jgi:hypothetical protein
LVLSEHRFGLAGDYVRRTRPFFALSDHELYLLAFIKTGVSGALDFRVMNEQILAAALGADKSESFASVKPFHNTFTHKKISFWPSMAVKSASRLFKRIFLRGVRINPTDRHYTRTPVGIQ